MITSDAIDWRTPDLEADEHLTREAVQRITAKLTRAELRLLASSIASELQTQGQFECSRLAKFIGETLIFCTWPKPVPVHLIAVSYALDLPFHAGRSMAAQARAMGVTRAAISHAARQYVTRHNLPVSESMRREASAEASKSARIRVCKTKTKTQ